MFTSAHAGGGPTQDASLSFVSNGSRSSTGSMDKVRCVSITTLCVHQPLPAICCARSDGAPHTVQPVRCVVLPQARQPPPPQTGLTRPLPLLALPCPLPGCFCLPPCSPSDRNRRPSLPSSFRPPSPQRARATHHAPLSPFLLLFPATALNATATAATPHLPPHNQNTAELRNPNAADKKHTPAARCCGALLQVQGATRTGEGGAEGGGSGNKPSNRLVIVSNHLPLRMKRQDGERPHPLLMCLPCVLPCVCCRVMLFVIAVCVSMCCNALCVVFAMCLYGALRCMLALRRVVEALNLHP